MDFKKEIIAALQKQVKTSIELEIPPDSKLGDFAFPCFPLAKELRKNPVEIAKDLAKKLKIKGVEKIVATGPYVNFFVEKSGLMKDTLVKVATEKESFGATNIGKGKKIAIEYSAPNIAKPFGIAHLRSTVIGNSLYKIHQFLGYNTLRLNHLGDWGTPYGKYIVAWKKWGNEKKLVKEGIHHLVSLYIKFEEEAAINPELEDEAREWFKKLEDGNKEALELWESFRDLSIEEFKRYYKRLNIDFDSYHGEAFYNDKIPTVVEHIKHKTKVELSEGALVVDLKKYNMPPFMIRKSDGASTYHIRDVAAALYRMKEYKPEKIVYVVGAPQLLHFQQVFKVLEMIGVDTHKFVHVPFGNMTFEGQMMKTRTGNFILLEEVLDKAIDIALKTINEKNPKLKNKKEVAEQVGIGAVIFGDLVNDRVRDVDFKWERVLDFEGETAPYIQYTYARINSLIEKSGQKISEKIDFDVLGDAEAEVVKKLGMFSEAVLQSYQNHKPHIVARYLIDLAQLFNAYYQNNSILKQEKNLRDARLFLALCVKQVLKNGLELLGIQAPEEM